MTYRGQTSPFFSHSLGPCTWWYDGSLFVEPRIDDCTGKYLLKIFLLSLLGVCDKKIESADILTKPAQVIINVEMLFLLVSIEVSSVVFCLVVRYCVRRVTPLCFIRHVKLV